MENFSFEGENYNICHKVRNKNQLSKTTFSQTADVVIIGAGISGLTSAYNLKDDFDLLVIEKEPLPGGASRRGKWNGIFYSYGAADVGYTYEITYNNKPYNFLDDFFKKLHIQLKKYQNQHQHLCTKINLLLIHFVIAKTALNHH